MGTLPKIKEIYPEWFGAEGDGTTDDTNSIQSALDYAKSIHCVVKLNYKKTYIVSKVGKINIQDSFHIMEYGYSLKIGSNVTFDLNQSTIKLADSQCALVLVNENPSGTLDANVCVDQNIHVKNGYLDNNRENQTTEDYQGCIYFGKVKYGSLKELEAINANIDGFRIMGCRECEFDYLYARNVIGHGFYMGRGGKYDLINYNCFFGYLYAEDCLNGDVMPPEAGAENNGNGFHVDLVDCIIQTFYDKNTDKGIKISGYCERINIDILVSDGSFVKFQDGPKDINVSNIMSYNTPLAGLYIYEGAENLNIENILLQNCYTVDDPNGHALWINGVNINITNVILKDCLSGGTIYIRTNSEKIFINRAIIKDCKGAINITNDNTVEFNSLVIDKGISAGNDYRGIAITSITPKVKINNLDIKGKFAFDDYIISVSDDLCINNVRLEDVDENSRVVTLSPGTSTTITSMKILYKEYNSHTVQPFINFLPIESTARGTAIKGYTVTNNSITIYHDTAAGTERYFLDISKYICSRDKFIY